MDLSNLYIPKAVDLLTPMKQAIEIGQERERIGLAKETTAINKAKLGIEQSQEERQKKTSELQEKRDNMPIYVDDLNNPNQLPEHKALGVQSLGKEGQKFKDVVLEYASNMDLLETERGTNRRFLPYYKYKIFQKQIADNIAMRKDLVQAKWDDVNTDIADVQQKLQDPKLTKPEDIKELVNQDTELRTRRNAIGQSLKGYSIDVDEKAGGQITDTMQITEWLSSSDPEVRKKGELAKSVRRPQAPEVSDITYAKRNAEAATAEKINYNATIGKQLAEIATVKQVEEQKVIGGGKVTDVTKKTTAKSRMTGNLATLGNHYLTLDSIGAIINVNNPSFDNLSARIKSSGAGQYIGQTFGTSAQSIRESINKLRPLLVQDIRQATDMGARGLDSEKELEFYLNAATNAKTDVQSNIAAIVVLDEAYGNGEISEQLRELTNEATVRAIKREGLQILKGKKQQTGGQTTTLKMPDGSIQTFDASGKRIK